MTTSLHDMFVLTVPLAEIDRLIEGDPEVLMEKGRLLRANLRRELITEAEFEAAAHKQGFDSLDEIERAILDVGGGISFFRKQPDPESARHAELLARLDTIERTLSAGRKGRSADGPD